MNTIFDDNVDGNGSDHEYQGHNERAKPEWVVTAPGVVLIVGTVLILQESDLPVVGFTQFVTFLVSTDLLDGVYGAVIQIPGLTAERLSSDRLICFQSPHLFSTCHTIHVFCAHFG